MIGQRLIGNLFGSRTTQELNGLVEAYVSQSKFSGAVLVAHKGDVLLQKGYGLANHEHDIPNTPQTVFRIGSMTKSFTALVTMLLVEEGRLKLDDAVSQFLPDFPNGEQIALRHLLCNTSGLPDYISTPEYEVIKKRHISTNDLIALFRDLPLQFKPGAEFGYSNFGWMLLGAILEQLEGKPYEQIVRKSIFAPLGMTRSGAEWEQPIIKHRAVGYVDTGEGLLNAELIDETTMHAAGALYSTVEDLFKWDRALAAGTLVRQETLQAMRMAVSPQYGYGWELHALHGRQSFGHSGGLPGYISNYAHFVDDDLTIILLSNLSGAAFMGLTEGLSAIVFGLPYEMPSARPFVTVDPAVFDDYVGEFNVTFFGRTSTLKFRVENGRLLMEISGLPTSILSAYSETTFYARPKGDVELTFVRETTGQVSTIDLNWSGHKAQAMRIS